MERLRRKWASITFLSIVIPVGLLVSFRLTGFLQEPLVPNLVQVDTVTWNWSRPMANTTIKWVNVSDKVTNVYDIEFLFVKFEVFVGGYHENDLVSPFNGNDGLGMILSFTANVSNGFVYSAIIRFSDIDNDAFLDIYEDPDSIFLHNVKSRNIIDGRSESFFEVLGINRPKQCNAEIGSFWVFLEDNIVDHQMAITLEVTCFNGIAYQEVVLPILLVVLQA